MIYFYNSLTSSKELFKPIVHDSVSMYVCGPTVYDVLHLGNLRSALVYDVIYRLLSACYSSVIYVRNITDVDDKIIAAAKLKNHSPIDFANLYTQIFHENVSKLGCLTPTFEPRATQHINDMIEMIKKLIESGNAYVTEGNVYFDVASCRDYAPLSGRNLDDVIIGNRIQLEIDKRNPNDFALWKATEDEYFSSPWGNGRPGWHIECSAMSTKYLGNDFDIHGGGMDLKFPHHDNEIAQSCCANPGSRYAHYWIHNGFLMVEGEKMSKSIGNVLYLDDLLKQGIKADVIRYALLSTYYRKPINWTADLVKAASSSFSSLKRCLKFYNASENNQVNDLYNHFFNIMLNDVNTPLAFSFLHKIASEVDYNNPNNSHNSHVASIIFRAFDLLGFQNIVLSSEMTKKIESLIAERIIAKEQKDFITSDAIRAELFAMNVEIHDHKDGTTTWEYN